MSNLQEPPDYEVPPVIVHEILDHIPFAEQAGEFLTYRGEWQRLKELCGDGQGVKIGIGDTGVDKAHLEGDLSGVKDAKDFTGSSYGYYDRHSHGSHTTGHIGARSNGDGMIGIASLSTLYHAKMLGDSGSGSTRGIANGIKWLADQGCEIINLSLGGSFSSEIEGACREVSEQGVLVNASMGNSGERGDGHPGNSRYTFGIVAVDWNKRVASFSSRSNMAKYSGYGVQVLSCGLNGKYVRMSGTSMSCPDFCGICGLILGYMKKNNIPTPTSMEQWEAVLLPGVEDLGAPGTDREYGIGWIDIWKVLAALTPALPPEKFTGRIYTESGRSFILGGEGIGTVKMTYEGKTFEGNAREIL